MRGRRARVDGDRSAHWNRLAEDTTPEVEYEAEHLEPRPWADAVGERHPFGFLYFIQPESGGPIKIGASVQPEQRLRRLQTASGERLVMRRTVRVHRSKLKMVEAEFHARFAGARLHGEWFRPTPELVRVAEAIPDLKAHADPGLDALAAAVAAL